MLSEAIHFFTHGSGALEFFFGTVWDPRFAGAGAASSSGQFGLIPLLAGTLYIGFVAMLVAVPVGLFVGDLHVGIRLRRAAFDRQSRCSRCSPASRRSSTASSR